MDEIESSMYLFFVVCGVGGKKKDTCYWRMVVNKGDREEHVFIFVWFVVLVEKKRYMLLCK